MKNIHLKSILLGIIGILLVGFGAGMLTKTGYGADTLNAAFTGISAKTNLSLGTINTIFNAVFIIVIFFVDRKLVGIGMILSVFILKFPIDFAMSIYPASPNIFVGFLSDVLSLSIFAFGAALMIESKMGATVYDGITLILTDRTKLSFRTVRFICDGTALLLGVLLHGQIGMGTVLSFALMAPLIDMFRKMINKGVGYN